MTNFEKWKDTILAITGNNDSVAVEDGVPCYCDDLDCKKCDFRGGCEKHRYEWLYAEYVETTVDWSKVPIDTKILVRDSEREPWVKRYFAGVNKKGQVLAFYDGATSWSGNSKILWNYAKLAEDENERL